MSVGVREGRAVGRGWDSREVTECLRDRLSLDACCWLDCEVGRREGSEVCEDDWNRVGGVMNC